jgi:hypothetical protein
MNILATDRSSRPIDVEDRITLALRHMTADEFRHLGLAQVAYLKSGTMKGQPVFALCGADGIPLAIVDTLDSALDNAAALGLCLINVH